jgi:HPt (histidine-containing phosphotransfer) domain-containing protein
MDGERVREFSGHEARYLRLLRSLVAGHPAFAANLQASLQRGDIASARAEAHSLRGAAATLGAQDVGRAIDALTAAIGHDAAAVDAQAVQRAVEVLAQATAAIADVLDRAAVQPPGKVHDQA